MIKLGWIGDGIKMSKNKSRRFESRFSTVKVNKTSCNFTKDLDELIFGIWIAHGEGKFDVNEKTLEELKQNNQIVMSYVDFDGNVTEKYPHNPNGSIDGIAGLCSKDGRHLAMMPHPERSFFKWQIPWMPNNIKLNNDLTPWFKMFNI